MENLSTPPDKQKKPKERILETAHRLFYQNGIRATGIDRIIAESSVTKTTFYRQFKSKNTLIIAYLEFRHELFIVDFKSNLDSNGGDVAAIADTLEQWFRGEGFRGCAFLNSVGELGTTIPEVKEITRKHKQELAEILETALPSSLPNDEIRQQIASAIALAVDGATVRAQFDQTPDSAVDLFKQIVSSLVSSQTHHD